jgi:regulator of sirC expression with transglutaminase-like and TPR domain
MEPTERFVEVVHRPVVPLDEAALLVAAHDHPVDVDAGLARLDALAADAPGDVDGLATYLFVERGYTGNALAYHDARNSYLDLVMERRLGIPISLSVLMLEVGRRRGVDVVGVGMPGHFLVRGEPGAFYDPFGGGARLDVAGCRHRYEQLNARGTFSERFLEPVDAAAIVARMLANLVGLFVPRDPVRASWALRLRLRVPGVPARERLEAAIVLGRLGHHVEGARELDELLPVLSGPEARRAETERVALRARAN